MNNNNNNNNINNNNNDTYKSYNTIKEIKNWKKKVKKNLKPKKNLKTRTILKNAERRRKCRELLHITLNITMKKLKKKSVGGDGLLFTCHQGEKYTNHS